MVDINVMFLYDKLKYIAKGLKLIIYIYIYLNVHVITIYIYIFIKHMQNTF